jgi:hypothetical protein
VSTPERAGLIAKIRQIRGPVTSEPDIPNPRPEPSARVEALEKRVEHLERMIEGLQDSVHREFQHQTNRITDLEARMDPAALAAALSKDARERGI